MKKLAVVVLLMGLLPALTSCAGKKIVIPPMDDAAQQYEVAYDAYLRAEQFIGESDQRTQAIEEAQVAFEAVLDRFPDDDVYTPMSDLMLARMQLTLHKNYKKAASMYRKVLDKYPEDARVQQIAIYELGVSLDGAGKYDDAKEAYRQLIERFGDDPALANNADAQRRLSEARRRYRMIRSPK